MATFNGSTTAVEMLQQEDTVAYHGDEDIVTSAHRAVKAGLIGKGALDDITSLHPKVPKSMALRYLKQYQFSKESSWYNRQYFLSTAINTEDIQLNPEHASDLIEILVKYASKWRLIGTALRFQAQDLDYIQASHASMVDSLKHSLIRLLDDWLQKKHKHTLPPTRNSLQQALRSSLVELGDVACDLFTNYRHPVGDATLPYSIITVSEDFRSASVTTKVVHTEENRSYRNKYVHETIRNDLDDVLQQKEEIEYGEVLNSLKSSQVLFVEGRPGCGKTTFVHKITQDWTTTHHGPIRLVLLVSLRVLNILYLQKHTLDLIDILKLFNKLRVGKEVLEERDGKGVCFIFDGLDEFSPRDGNDSIVFQIIKKSYLRKSTVIVASRPAAIAKWRGKANKVIEVLGFLKEQILEYFDSYHFSEELKSAELRTYLFSHPNVLHMCYLPIHAAMVAYLYEVTGEIPRTETEIYTHFMHCTLMRSLTKNVTVDEEKIDVTNLSGNEKKLVSQICRLALKKTVENKQFLQQDEVRESFETKTGEDISLGLITIDRIADLYNYKNIYTFLHLTFQEYLAACHISTLTVEEQSELIHEHGGKNHMLVVWKFYCGLVKFDSTGSMFKVLVHKTAARTLHNIQCAYESQQPIACNVLLENTDATLSFQSQYLTTPDFTALGYVLANNGISYPISLSLVDCAINSAGIDALLSETGESKKACFLRELKYSSDTFDDIMLRCLEKLLLISRSLELLELSSSDATTPCSLDNISDTISMSCSDLTELSVTNILIGPNNIQYVLNGCKQLKKIALHNSFGIKEVTMLVAELKVCGSLEFLNISYDLSTEICVPKTFELCSNFEAVNFNIVGHKVDLSLSHQPNESSDSPTECYSDRLKKRLNRLKLDNCHSSEVFSDAADGINYIRRLEVLEVSNYSHRQVELLKLINNLDQHSSLRIVNLDRANLNAAGAKALSSSLKHCTALTTLNLRGNMIEKEGVQALSMSFQYWPNLRELNLDGTEHQTNIGKGGAVILAGNLHFCTHLSQLHLEYNYIDDEVGLLLIHKLQNKPRTELHLYGNLVRQEWARTIKISDIVAPMPQSNTRSNTTGCCILF